jgi:hypothetical protein
MSRMLNRLKNADKSRDEAVKADNKYDALLQKKKEEVAQLLHDQESSVEDALTQTEETSQVDELQSCEEETLESEEALCIETPLPKRIPNLEEGVIQDEVEALFGSDEEENVRPSVFHMSASFIGTVLLSLFLASLVIGGAVLLLSKSGGIDSRYYSNIAALFTQTHEKSLGVIHTLQGKKPVHIILNNCNSTESLQSVRVYNSKVSLVQGMRTDLDDYSLNLSFKQAGDRPYSAKVDFLFNSIDVSVIDMIDISFMLKSAPETLYPLALSVVLYSDSGKFEKDLGLISDSWKRYTIPLSSFEGSDEISALTKLRIVVSQPRQLNESYDVFIDDVELKGVNARVKEDAASLSDK